MTEKQAPNEFDIAAEKAEKELHALLEVLGESEIYGARVVINWQANNYQKAGHKRLGRILVKIAKDS